MGVCITSIINYRKLGHCRIAVNNKNSDYNFLEGYGRVNGATHTESGEESFITKTPDPNGYEVWRINDNEIYVKLSTGTSGPKYSDSSTVYEDAYLDVHPVTSYIFHQYWNWYTNPTNPDTDGDGLSDFDEIKKYDTNPTVIDTDGDGTSDGEEVNSYGFSDNEKNSNSVSRGDPNNKDDDCDKDGLTTEYEKNTLYDYSETNWDGEPGVDYTTNPELYDTDGDGLSDKFEADFHFYDEELNPYFEFLNPLVKDTDGDGILDGDETVDFLYLFESSNEPYLIDDYLSNYDEQEAYTWPWDEDFDDDNYCDGIEVFIGSDPLEGSITPLDIDGDNIENSNDLDNDNDGLSNNEEILWDQDSKYNPNSDTNPLNPDTDGDDLKSFQYQGIFIGDDEDCDGNFAPNEEIIDGIDNDGDGRIDEEYDYNDGNEANQKIKRWVVDYNDEGYYFFTKLETGVDYIFAYNTNPLDEDTDDDGNVDSCDPIPLDYDIDGDNKINSKGLVYPSSQNYNNRIANAVNNYDRFLETDVNGYVDDLDMDGDGLNDGNDDSDMDADGMPDLYEVKYGEVDIIMSEGSEYAENQVDGEGWQNPFIYNARYALLTSNHLSNHPKTDKDIDDSGFYKDMENIYNKLVEYNYNSMNIHFLYGLESGINSNIIDGPATFQDENLIIDDVTISSKSWIRCLRSICEKITINDFFFIGFSGHGSITSSPGFQFMRTQPQDGFRRDTQDFCDIAKTLDFYLGADTSNINYFYGDGNRYSRMVIYIDCCYAGGGIKYFTGTNRIVITSVTSWEETNRIVDKSNDFSKYFSSNLESLTNPQDLANAFYGGSLKDTDDNEHPLLEDNGNSDSYIDFNGVNKEAWGRTYFNTICINHEWLGFLKNYKLWAYFETVSTKDGYKSYHTYL